MGVFRPVPFAVLCRRMLREAERGASIFDLPARRFVLSPGDRDLSVRIHGRVAATPLGPSAGPHTQLAQNIVLSWLAGGRVIELKTVQARDDLTIPRPCIDARTVGYNVEWSQELTLAESLEEYVKASMLIEILAASGLLRLAPGFERTVFEASVGYDLAGIAGERVQGFLRGLRDARPMIDLLRREIPDEWRSLRDLDFTARVAGGVTLSTFHGCPPSEIERIVELLLQEDGLPVVIKLNPTLLGARDLLRLLHEEMGYRDVVVPEAAFARDLGWDEAMAMIARAKQAATARGLDLGVKLTNTLLVENPGGFLPATEKEAYLSGPPLHVLAIELVRRVRRALGAGFPISFSAGIDARNFPDAVALGLAPVTVCTDWLKAGGYGRGARYFEELAARMDSVGARTIEELVRRGDVEAYADAVAKDARYSAAANARPPKKTGKHLTLLDCIACDKCIPVCPNDANFAFARVEAEIPIVKLRKVGAAWERRDEGVVRIEHDHQIGNVIDLCNECGNCDAFCPEEGGPYRVKPRFFGSSDAFRARPATDGFWMERREGRDRVLGRVGGREVTLDLQDGHAAYAGPGFSVRFDPADPEGTIEGEATEEVDLGLFRVIDSLRRAVLSPASSNWVNSAC